MLYIIFIDISFGWVFDIFVNGCYYSFFVICIYFYIDFVYDDIKDFFWEIEVVFFLVGFFFRICSLKVMRKFFLKNVYSNGLIIEVINWKILNICVILYKMFKVCWLSGN